MCAALETGDMDKFSELLQDRGELLRSVADDMETDAFSTDEAVRALSEQHVRLERAMNETRVGLGAAVAAVSRFRGARKAYDAHLGENPGRLNKYLRG